MNQRIHELALKAGLSHMPSNYPDMADLYKGADFELEKFAMLVVRECVDKMLNSDDEHFMKQEGWDLGGPNHNAWTRGVLDSVAVVKEHFGVEE